VDLVHSAMAFRQKLPFAIFKGKPFVEHNGQRFSETGITGGLLSPRTTPSRFCTRTFCLHFSAKERAPTPKAAARGPASRRSAPSGVVLG
jgi:hypothetical protein